MTIDLIKIADLLQKGVNSSLLQNHEGFFSAEMWKKHVQIYTEPFLKAVVEKAGRLTIDKNMLHIVEGFLIMLKEQKKQKTIDSLQEAICKMSEPFTLAVDDKSSRPVQLIVQIGPAWKFEEKSYESNICWGADWWGGKEKAMKMCKAFQILNDNGVWTIAKATVSYFGGTLAWCFRSASLRDILEKNPEELTSEIAQDLVDLLSEFYKKKDEFLRVLSGSDEESKKHYPTKNDCERIIHKIKSLTGVLEIADRDVLHELESYFVSKDVSLKGDWRKETKDNFTKWFG